MLNEGTIIAKATPSGISAISVIRLSGADSIKMVSSCFKAKSGKLLANQKSHTIHLGTIYDKERDLYKLLIKQEGPTASKSMVRLQYRGVPSMRPSRSCSVHS